MSPWSAPFYGLLFFLARPRMWLGFLFGLLVMGLSIAGAFCLGTFAFAHKNWFYAVCWGLFAAILDFALVVPMLLNLFFYRSFSRELKHVKGEGMLASAFSSLIVFFRTLRWRILWPVLLLVCLFYAPPLVLPVSLLAASHLFVLESADLVLSVFGEKAGERVLWIRSHAWDLWRMTLSASALAILLSFLPLVGWLLWLPAIPAGVWISIRDRKSNSLN